MPRPRARSSVVDTSCVGELSRKIVEQPIRNHRDAVLETLAIAHDDLPARQVDVLNAQAYPFHDSQPCAVKQTAEQCVDAAKLGQQGGDFRTRKDDWQTNRRLGAGDMVEPRQVGIQHLPIEKEQGGLGLVLRRRGHVTFDRQMAEKRLDVLGPQNRRMSLAVKMDVASNPVRVSLLGPDAVVLEPDSVANAYQESRWWRRIHAWR